MLLGRTVPLVTVSLLVVAGLTPPAVTSSKFLDELAAQCAIGPAPSLEGGEDAEAAVVPGAPPVPVQCAWTAPDQKTAVYTGGATTLACAGVPGVSSLQATHCVDLSVVAAHDADSCVVTRDLAGRAVSARCPVAFIASAVARQWAAPGTLELAWKVGGLTGTVDCGWAPFGFGCIRDAGPPGRTVLVNTWSGPVCASTQFVASASGVIDLDGAAQSVGPVRPSFVAHACYEIVNGSLRYEADP